MVRLELEVGDLTAPRVAQPEAPCLVLEHRSPREEVPWNPRAALPSPDSSRGVGSASTAPLAAATSPRCSMPALSCTLLRSPFSFETIRCMTPSDEGKLAVPRDTQIGTARYFKDPNSRAGFRCLECAGSLGKAQSLTANPVGSGGVHSEHPRLQIHLQPLTLHRLHWLPLPFRLGWTRCKAALDRRQMISYAEACLRLRGFTQEVVHSMPFVSLEEINFLDVGALLSMGPKVLDRLELLSIARSKYNILGRLLLFMALYTIFLYSLDGDGSRSSQVYSTITRVVSPSQAYNSEVEIYGWLDSLVKHIYTDPVCGNDVCEEPYERRAFGRFGCQTDCGQEPTLYDVAVKFRAPSVAPVEGVSVASLVASMKWNLCLRSVEPGVDDLCWYAADKGIQSPGHKFVADFSLPPGDWYVRIENDFYGVLAGAVYNGLDLLEIATDPPWNTCQALYPASLYAAGGASMLRRHSVLRGEALYAGRHSVCGGTLCSGRHSMLRGEALDAARGALP
ncbi:hypothetical protein CYMTET_25692 [Cymbomonas tetramitiformis]|uniref:Uncharacterized protein n=1 Tax=Cymbomonas tetramitiformis TaxID=36881 RepID=A0AAE0FUU7_9CHLO|nr:hypothetical protein CYMTET_25692 [Cymbomonas tetramitiformis]